jgi:NAD(P)-dependent dehydrogenase (short-subunit alcohol dehydrogenase family)
MFGDKGNGVRIDLTGHRVIVTGGANGIGRAAAEFFLGSGARAVTLDIDDEAARKAWADADKNKHLHLQCDVTSRASVDQAFDKAVAFLGGLDTLCHPAGRNARGMAEDLTDADMRRMLDINVMGTLYTNQAAFKYMREKGGSIINFTSESGIRGQRNSAHYSASKGAVAAWTRSVAMDWGKYNIRVNAVAPRAWTQMVDVGLSLIPESERAAQMERANSMSLLPGGLRKGDDIAPVLAFLASDGAGYITGQCLSVDGGVMMLGS